MELLRKESLAGLAPAAAARVLSHAYAAVVPIAPLPYPPLPLAPNRPGEHPGSCLSKFEPCTVTFVILAKEHRSPVRSQSACMKAICSTF